MRKVLVKSYGCQMNVYDSELIYNLLSSHGYQRGESAADADLVILNTCNIREKAAEKVYSELGRLKPLKARAADEGRRLLVGVVGCVAQAEGLELLRRAPMVDLVMGPQAYARLPEVLANVLTGDKAAIDITFSPESKFDDVLGGASEGRGVTAFLTIQEGCDKFCTFCVVPYTRGVEYSRPVADVLAEAEALVARGVAEVTVIGQNVNAYHGIGPDGEGWSLARLITRLVEFTGIGRVRYTTSHPLDMDNDLIALHGTLPQLMPYVHLPVQSGSDRILATMNRRHTADDYRRVVERLRRARPDLALSTDLIVGFPGETDEDFAATLRLVEDIEFAQAYSFKYSPRPGTPAADAPQVDEAVKRERLAILQRCLDRQQRAFNRSLVGSKQAVLFDGNGRHPGQIVGRTPYLQAVHVDGPASLIGRTEDVLIVRAHENSLAGVLPSRAVA